VVLLTTWKSHTVLQQASAGVAQDSSGTRSGVSKPLGRVGLLQRGKQAGLIECDAGVLTSLGFD
jgi:hypothetical protein